MSQVLQTVKREQHAETQRIAIRRKHLLADALHCCRKGIDPRKSLKVTFVGEPGIDDGGPLREFFHLLIDAISQDNNLFTGSSGRLVPRVNITEREKKTFFHMGTMVGMSLVSEGPGAHFFTPAVVDYVTFGMNKVRATPLDVPDEEIRVKLIKVFQLTIQIKS